MLYKRQIHTTAGIKDEVWVIKKVESKIKISEKHNDYEHWLVKRLEEVEDV